MKPNFTKEVVELQKELFKIRRLLHSNPELSFQEKDTAVFIKDYLLKINRVEVIAFPDSYGIVSIIKGQFPGPTIAFRADMDGLAVTEAYESEYKSRNSGVMHACGHDGHMAMLMIATKIIASKWEKLSGNIISIFQPAEEYAGAKSGAAKMIDAGLFNPNILSIPSIDEIYGIHLWSNFSSNTVHCRLGNIMANTDRFHIDIKGKGGHGSAPHLTRDSIAIAANLINSIQLIVSRYTNPLETAVISIGRIEGGSCHNAIADSVSIDGTIRSFDTDIRSSIKNRMNSICEGTSLSFDCKIELQFVDGVDAVYNNDDHCYERVRSVATKIIGEKNVYTCSPLMAGEDFSLYLKEKKGCFFFVGAAPGYSSFIVYNIELDDGPVPHHSPMFHINENSLMLGCSIWCQLAELLNK